MISLKASRIMLLQRVDHVITGAPSPGGSSYFSFKEAVDWAFKHYLFCLWEGENDVSFELVSADIKSRRSNRENLAQTIKIESKIWICFLKP